MLTADRSLWGFWCLCSSRPSLPWETGQPHWTKYRLQSTSVIGPTVTRYRRSGRTISSLLGSCAISIPIHPHSPAQANDALLCQRLHDDNLESVGVGLYSKVRVIPGSLRVTHSIVPSINHHYTDHRDTRIVFQFFILGLDFGSSTNKPLIGNYLTPKKRNQ